MSEKSPKKPTPIPQDLDKKLLPQDEDDRDSGTGEAGGTSTTIRWVDPLAGPTRDDLLSPQEKKRLMQVHDLASKLLIDKQKHTIAQRKLLKENPRQAQQKQSGKGLGSRRGGAQSRYREHPIAKKFAGKIDEKLSPLANENTSDTNAEAKEANDLKNELRLQNKLQHRNTPKLRPPGM